MSFPREMLSTCAEQCSRRDAHWARRRRGVGCRHHNGSVTSPTAYSGRPLAPAPGTTAPELRVATIRPHARRLVWSALLLIAVCGATGYFSGNLPEPFTNVMLWSAAGLVIIVLVVFPWLAWMSHTYTITTRRVIESSGLWGRRRSEVTHAQGCTITERRGILQRLWGTGDVILSTGTQPPMRLRNVPAPRLVHETLVDQIEVGQILAHRGSPSTSDTADLPPLV